MAKFWTSFKRAYRGRTLGDVRRSRGNADWEYLLFSDYANNSCSITPNPHDLYINVPDGEGSVWLSRHQVEALINHLESWLDYGTLEVRR